MKKNMTFLVRRLKAIHCLFAAVLFLSLTISVKGDDRLIPPSVTITAWLDDHEVNAVFHEDQTTPFHIDNLIPNAPYTGDLHYEQDGCKYLGKIDFKADWHGTRELKIYLNPAFSTTTIPLQNAPSIQLVKVRAASFIMGADDGASNERLHSVTLTQDFWISRHEITQQQWKAIMKTNPSNYKSDNHPVENITWNDAMAFCERLNLLAINDLPRGYKATLPTEAQWEFAARGGSFSENYLYSGGDNLDDVAWHSANAAVHTQPVGMKRPNELGLYDMTGNVWEWCLDRCQWDRKVITDTYADYMTDPLCATGDLHILRGGGWVNSPSNCRIAKRLCGDTNFKIHNLGLRIVLVPAK